MVISNRDPPGWTCRKGLLILITDAKLPSDLPLRAKKVRESLRAGSVERSAWEVTWPTVTAKGVKTMAYESSGTLLDLIVELLEKSEAIQLCECYERPGIGNDPPRRRQDSSSARVSLLNGGTMPRA